MIMVVCSVFDRAVGAYGRPLFMQSKGVAIRSFSDECKRVADDNQMNKHPQDFSLFELGTWDDQTGKFEQHDQPQQIINGSQT